MSAHIHMHEVIGLASKLRPHGCATWGIHRARGSPRCLCHDLPLLCLQLTSQEPSTSSRQQEDLSPKTTGLKEQGFSRNESKTQPVNVANGNNARASDHEPKTTTAGYTILGVPPPRAKNADQHLESKSSGGWGSTWGFSSLKPKKLQR